MAHKVNGSFSWEVTPPSSFMPPFLIYQIVINLFHIQIVINEISLTPVNNLKMFTGC